MEDKNFTLPDIDWPILAPFWQACLKEELKFPRCSQCQRWQWYPIIQCPSCGGSFEWATVSGKGTLYSWTVVRKAYFPEFADKVPFIVAIVDIDEAPGVRLVATLKDFGSEELRIGMEMSVIFEHVNDSVSLPAFRIKKKG